MLEARLEAALGVTSRPITVATLADALTHSVAEIEAALATLTQSLAAHGRPWRIVRSGERVRMETRPEFAEDVRRVRESERGPRPQRPPSPSAMDVLALIALQPGITLPEITRIREADSAALVEALRRRKLIKPMASRPGQRARRWVTTETFLTQFDLEATADVGKAVEAGAMRKKVHGTLIESRNETAD
jgi:segregation and condensation protein B